MTIQEVFAAAMLLGLVLLAFRLASKGHGERSRPPSVTATRSRSTGRRPPRPVASPTRPAVGREGWASEPPPLPKGCGQALTGRAWVIDGDTIIIRKIKVRLWGIDAPELDEPWGRKSRSAMIDICKGSVVTATLTGETSHDRYVARCMLEDGTDVSAELVRRGLALDWPMFSGGAYRDVEQPGFRRRLAGVRRRMRATATPRPSPGIGVSTSD